MNKTYYFLIVLTFALGIGALFLPQSLHTKEISPEELFFEMNNPSRFVTTDQVARLIIEGDPTIMLIDTRPYDQYELYSLPGAMSVPLEELIDSTGAIDLMWEDYLGVEDMNTILFSNGDISADQAWVLCTRLGIENMFVMKGGLNHWVETILKPVAPLESAPNEDFALYDFRKGASIYFGGGSIEIESQTISEPLPQVRKKKQTVIEGGC